MRRSSRLLEKQYLKDSQMILDEPTESKKLKQTKLPFKSVKFNCNSSDSFNTSDTYEYDSDDDVIMSCVKCNLTVNKCSCSSSN